MKYTSAKIIGDSINPYNDQRVTTFEITFPRIILAEFNTHKMIEKNFSSSRAIPFKTMVDNTENEMFAPSEWGENKSGMSSDNLLDSESVSKCEELWLNSFYSVKTFAMELSNNNLHKQWCNRLLEPYQYVKGVCTATDYDNFFWLRVDKDAQPEIRDLAEKMKKEYYNSSPKLLNDGEWHIPYFKFIGYSNHGLETANYRNIINNNVYNLDDALKISVSLCAQRSYRNEDASLERAERIEKILLGSDKKHWSPYGHQATPIYNGFNQDGVTHMNKRGLFGSGNLYGWVQYRHLFKDSDKCNYSK